MFVKRIVATGIATLFISACGGAVEEEQAPQELASTEQAIIWACNGGSSWTRYWYSDSSRTNEVGREDCYCDGSLYAYGTTRGYYSQVSGPSCTGGGGGGGGSGGGCRTTNNIIYPPPEC